MYQQDPNRFFRIAIVADLTLTVFPLFVENAFPQKRNDRLTRQSSPTKRTKPVISKTARLDKDLEPKGDSSAPVSVVNTTARIIREKAVRKIADYTTRLAAIESEAQQILADARAQGEAERARILAEATTTAQKFRADAKTRLDQESKKLAHELELHAVELATQVAERIIVKHIGENHRKALFGDYVDQVENKGLLGAQSSGGIQ